VLRNFGDGDGRNPYGSLTLDLYGTTNSATSPTKVTATYLGESNIVGSSASVTQTVQQ
jgi:hypothetical protein